MKWIGQKLVEKIVGVLDIKWKRGMFCDGDGPSTTLTCKLCPHKITHTHTLPYNVWKSESPTFTKFKSYPRPSCNQPSNDTSLSSILIKKIKIRKINCASVF